MVIQFKAYFMFSLVSGNFRKVKANSTQGMPVPIAKKIPLCSRLIIYFELFFSILFVLL